MRVDEYFVLQSRNCIKYIMFAKYTHCSCVNKRKLKLWMTRNVIIYLT